MGIMVMPMIYTFIVNSFLATVYCQFCTNSLKGHSNLYMSTCRVQNNIQKSTNQTNKGLVNCSIIPQHYILVCHFDRSSKRYYIEHLSSTKYKFTMKSQYK